MLAARQKPPHGRSSSARASRCVSATAHVVALAAEAVDAARAGAARSGARRRLRAARERAALAGAYAEAIAAADRARALAETLGLPEPARALGYRGFARVYLGDADGLAEMERALALLVERGAGRDAAILQNNLALARYPLQGPARSLADFEEGIAFCEQRGLGEPAAMLEANCPSLLAELGRPEEALERVGRLAAVAEAQRRHALADRAARGRARDAASPAASARRHVPRPTG